MAKNKPIAKMLKVCPWCHSQFFSYRTKIYCCAEHGLLFNKTKEQIGKRFFSPEFEAEIAKLNEQGCNYQLPERDLTYLVKVCQ